MKKGWIGGVWPIREVLRAGRRKVYRILVTKGRGDKRVLDKRIGMLKREAARQRVSWEMSSDTDFQELVGPINHQGVIAEVDPFQYHQLEDVLPERPEMDLTLIILDRVEDVGNMGAIIRSSAVMGVSGLIIPDRRSVSITPAVLRASAGATEWVPIIRVASLSSTVKYLRERGVWTVGTVVDGGRNPCEVDLRIPLALMMGSEGEGLRRSLLRQCDILLTMPSPGALSVLNVSVATGVHLYEIVRQKTYVKSR